MTKLEYLQRLPETYNGLPLRKMALENYDAGFSPRFNMYNAHDALCNTFSWKDSPQKFQFWCQIAEDICKGELKIIDNQIKMEL
jgi:hypothetical protein